MEENMKESYLSLGFVSPISPHFGYVIIWILSPLPSKDVLRASLANSGTLTAQQLEDTVNYTYQVTASSHSIFNMLLIVLSAILVVVAFVFLVRKTSNSQTMLILAMFY